MADDIRTLSALLAREPASMRYIELAEALRRRGKLGEAELTVRQGLSRHPQHADGYDCLARIHADHNQLREARAAWEQALAIAPEHGGALRGIGFIFYRQGDHKRAIDALEHALRADPGDEAARRALMSLGVAVPGQGRDSPDAQDGQDAPGDQEHRFASREEAAHAAATAATRAPVFAGLEGATQDMLLLDARGLVLAGGLFGKDGTDASELAAAALAGVSGEATRAADYLQMGAWNVIVAESNDANIVLAPVTGGSLLMLRRDVSMPVGLALRIAERARGAAAQWLEEHT